MPSFVACPECGARFSRYMAFIESIRNKLIETQIFGKKSKFNQYAPDKIITSSETELTIGKVLDLLKVNNECCRTHMITVTNFNIH